MYNVLLLNWLEIFYYLTNSNFQITDILKNSIYNYSIPNFYNISYTESSLVTTNFKIDYLCANTNTSFNSKYNFIVIIIIYIYTYIYTFIQNCLQNGIIIEFYNYKFLLFIFYIILSITIIFLSLVLILFALIRFGAQFWLFFFIKFITTTLILIPIYNNINIWNLTVVIYTYLKTFLYYVQDYLLVDNNLFLLLTTFAVSGMILILFSLKTCSFRLINSLVISYYLAIIVLLMYQVHDFYFFNKICIFNLGCILKFSPICSFYFYFYFDLISVSFILLINIITFLILLYIGKYFKHENEMTKFALLIILFSIFMSLFVSAGNMFLIFLFWELIGVVSFLLINFYFLRISVTKVAYKVFLFNKISDAFLLSGIILFNFYGITNINLLIVDSITLNINFGTYFIILACAIKSSQFGFHFWLPDSMEAPLPASALIHSATLVSAGVYILLRFNKFIILDYNLQLICYFWFGLTALYGSSCAMYQVDIKKLLAYSTISHCGFLCAMALNPYYCGTLFYLYIHGMLKAMSFIFVGRLINTFQSQDLRKMSQVALILPIDYILLILILLNLSAIPGFFGLFYKNIFLFSLFLLNYNFISNFILCIYLLASIASIGYTLQILQCGFGEEIKWRRAAHAKIAFIKSGNIKLKNYFILLWFGCWIMFITFMHILFFFEIQNEFIIIFSNNNRWIVKLYYTLLISFIICTINLMNPRKPINHHIWQYYIIIVMACLINVNIFF